MRAHNALAEQVKALEAEVRALRDAQGELLGLVDRPATFSASVNGSGRAYSIEVPPGESGFIRFDKSGKAVDWA